jgi:mannose-6-phosphate isomerase
LDEHNYITFAHESRWMGTYPDLPSYVLSTGEDLQDVLDKNADELIGKTVAQKFNHTKLPYLPKVLSIAKALPLQLHPVSSPAEDKAYKY